MHTGYRIEEKQFLFSYFFFFSPDVALTSGHNDKDQSQEFAMAVAIAGRQSKVSAFLFFLFFFSLFYFSPLMIKAVSALSSTMSLSSGWQRECLRSSLEYLGSDSGPPSELPAELDPLLVGSGCCFVLLVLSFNSFGADYFLAGFSVVSNESVNHSDVARSLLAKGKWERVSADSR